MKKPHVQQRTERRISAALRLVMVAVLLVAQIALVFLLSDVLKQRMALAYSALELLAAVVAVTIWSRPGRQPERPGGGSVFAVHHPCETVGVCDHALFGY